MSFSSQDTKYFGYGFDANPGLTHLWVIIVYTNVTIYSTKISTLLAVAVPEFDLTEASTVEVWVIYVESDLAIFIKIRKLSFWSIKNYGSVAVKGDFWWSRGRYYFRKIGVVLFYMPSRVTSYVTNFQSEIENGCRKLENYPTMSDRHNFESTETFLILREQFMWLC